MHVLQPQQDGPDTVSTARLVIFGTFCHIVAYVLITCYSAKCGHIRRAELRAACGVPRQDGLSSGLGEPH